MSAPNQVILKHQAHLALKELLVISSFSARSKYKFKLNLGFYIKYGKEKSTQSTFYASGRHQC